MKVCKVYVDFTNLHIKDCKVYVDFTNLHIKDCKVYVDFTNLHIKVCKVCINLKLSNLSRFVRFGRFLKTLTC